MAQQKPEQLTHLELEIMNVLWVTGSANVQTVQQGLQRELAYATVIHIFISALYDQVIRTEREKP